MTDSLDEALQKPFDESTRIYKERGFQRRIGFGKKPALVSIDVANAWPRPGDPLNCKGIDDKIIPTMKALLKAPQNTDMGLWAQKIPV